MVNLCWQAKDTYLLEPCLVSCGEPLYLGYFFKLFFAAACISLTEKAYALQGSFGFFSGCLMMMHPIFGYVSSRLISSWFGLFFGYALGSCCFLLGSYAMIIDLANL